MNEEPQIFARWIDPTIDDLKIALGEANKQIDILSKEIERLNKELEGKDILIKMKTERIQNLMNRLAKRQDKVDRLKEIAHKMHLWIFLHSGDEQKVYDELGLTDEENAMLGYSGQFRIESDKDVKD